MADKKFDIRIANREQASIVANIIREANTPIAEELGLTQKSAPRHPSQMTREWVLSDMGKREVFFILYLDDTPIGTVSYKSVGGGVSFLARLSILPPYQGFGYGVKLVDHHILYSHSQGDRRVDLGVIESHKHLINWYQSLGFVIKNSKSFKHLPFKVTFMRRELRESE